MVYIIDWLEHGNMGCHGTKLLDALPVAEALKKTPSDYDVTEKWWGFWPTISKDKAGKHILYRWNDDSLSWRKI